MSEDLAKTLNCPTCGAPLDFDGTSAVIRCKFCRTVSFVPGVLPAQAAAPGLALDEVRRLAKAGNLADAIKLYRETFGVDQGEANDAVGALQADRLVTPGVAREGAPTPSQQTQALEEVQRLLGQGNKIEAIKKYREVFDVSLTRAKQALDQIEAGQTVPSDAGFPAQAAEAQPSRSGNRLGWVVGTSILLFVGAILAFTLSQPGGPFNPYYYINGPAILLPSEAGSQPEVAALFFHPDSDARMIGLVNGQTGKFLWRAAPLAGDGYADAVAAGPDLIYTTNGTDLLAYHRSDGSLAWQAEMPDKLNYGDATMFVVDNRVITSNLDQSLQAYDAGTGDLVWTRRLSGYDRSLRMMGSSLVLVDYTDDTYTYRLIFVDPVDGSQQRILTPACQTDQYSSDTIDPDSALIYDQATNALYVIYDSSPGCIQRLDLASGQTSWQTLDDDPSGFSVDAAHILTTGDALYFGSENQLLAVDRTTGKLQTLLTNEDYEFTPLAATGQQLIVRARRTRGTERFELWALDRASGSQTWQLTLDNAAPIDPPDEMAGLIDNTDTGYTWRLAPAGLVLIKFQGGPNQIVLDTINPADGTALGEQTLPLRGVSGDFYTIPTVIGWQGNVAYLNVDTGIYTLDLASGKLKLVQ